MHYKFLLPIVFCFSLINAQSASKDFPRLDAQSKFSVARAAFVGAVGGMVTYALGHCIFSNHSYCTFTDHYKAYSISALIGSWIVGRLKYNYTPESHYKYVKEGMEKLSKDRLFNALKDLSSYDIIKKVKEHFIKEKLPLISAFTHLEILYKDLVSYKESLEIVLQSHRTDLHDTTLELQTAVLISGLALENVLQTIKDDPNFVYECTANTQMIAAAAAVSSANAAWANFFMPSSHTYFFV